MTTTTKDGEVMREIASLDNGISPTAANAFNRLYSASGVIPYRVVLANGSAQQSAVVNAATGDEAAELGLRKHPGCKVVGVFPAGDEARITDDLAGQ